MDGRGGVRLQPPTALLSPRNDQRSAQNRKVEILRQTHITSIFASLHRRSDAQRSVQNNRRSSLPLREERRCRALWIRCQSTCQTTTEPRKLTRSVHLVDQVEPCWNVEDSRVRPR